MQYIWKIYLKVFWLKQKQYNIDQNNAIISKPCEHKSEQIQA